MGKEQRYEGRDSAKEQRLGVETRVRGTSSAQLVEQLDLFRAWPSR